MVAYLPKVRVPRRQAAVTEQDRPREVASGTPQQREATAQVGGGRRQGDRADPRIRPWVPRLQRAGSADVLEVLDTVVAGRVVRGHVARQRELANGVDV